MDLLSSFMKTASINEELFNKSKELTLKILGTNSKKEIVSIVESSFSDDFKDNYDLINWQEGDKKEKGKGHRFRKTY